MKKSTASTLIAPFAVLAMLAAIPGAQAGLNTASISIHFGAEQPMPIGSFLAPGDVAGIVPSENWNNETTNTGSDPSLIQDVNGVASNSGAKVLWYATSTWSSAGIGAENNNDFTGADRKLMSGYLDMQNNNPEVTFIQISNLPASFSAAYTVYIYALGGQPGRGGIYSVNEPANQGIPGTFQYLVASGTHDPAKRGNQGYFNGAHYVQAIGDDPSFGHHDFGNYLVFPGQSGPTVTITSINLPMPQLRGYDHSYHRAPINGVQIVAD
jgi:hypothetical protein